MSSGVMIRYVSVAAIIIAAVDALLIVGNECMSDESL